MKDNYTDLVKELIRGAAFWSQIDLESVQPLSGGVVSLILSVGLQEALPGGEDSLVVKHTFAEINPAPVHGHTDNTSLLEPARDTHHLDFEFLEALQKDNDLLVPTVQYYNKSQAVTVMTDFRSQGFTLMQELLVHGNLTGKSAKEVGRSLAKLTIKMRSLSKKLKAVEDSTAQARERLEELYGFLRSNLDLYRSIEKRFISGTTLVPTDTHPKNIALSKKQDKAMLFDFGRSIVADEQFVSPNFAAHIGLGLLGGCFADQAVGREYLKKFVKSFQKHFDKKVDELSFVQYFTAELLHRGLSGRWLDPKIFTNSSLQEVERAVHDIAIEVFRPEDGSVETIDGLFTLLFDTAKQVQAGKYKGRRA